MSALWILRRFSIFRTVLLVGCGAVSSNLFRYVGVEGTRGGLRVDDAFSSGLWCWVSRPWYRFRRVIEMFAVMCSLVSRDGF